MIEIGDLVKWFDGYYEVIDTGSPTLTGQLPVYIKELEGFYTYRVGALYLKKVSALEALGAQT